MTALIKNTQNIGKWPKPSPNTLRNYYLLRLISSSRSVSDVVMTREFA